MSKRALKPSHTSGKKFVLGLGIGFVILGIGLFVGIWGYLHILSDSRPPEVPLNWDARTAYPTFAMKPYELEYDRFVQAETGQKYKKSVFCLSTDVAEEKRIETALLACAKLARQDAASFCAEPTRLALEAQAAAFPRQFYPAYLLACWHHGRRNPEQTARWMRMAVAAAPAMLTEGGHAPNQTISTLAIVFDRLRDTPTGHGRKIRILNRDLVLVYPRPFADERGTVYLPVFHDTYRWADPFGSGMEEPKDWFSMADGARMGRLDGADSMVPPRP